MKRFLAALSITLILVLIGFLVWRRFQQGQPVAAPRLDFARPGVAKVHNRGNAQTIDVYDAAGRLVARAQAFRQPLVEMRFPWQPGARYRVVADEGPSSQAQAPTAAPEFVVRLHAPLGQTPHEYAFGRPYSESPRRDVAVPAGPGEIVDVMLEVEKLTDGPPITFQVSSKIDPKDAGNLRMDAKIEDDDARLELEFDKTIWTSQVRLGRRLPAEPLVITLRAGEFVLPLGIRFTSRKLDAGGLSIEAWRLPTEADGFHERQRVADRISMPNPVWIEVASWFGIRPEVPNFYDPFVYQTVWIRNRTSEPISLLLASEILDPDTGQPVEFFAAREFESSGGTDRIMAYSHIGPGETRPCVLPVFVRPETPEGTYLRRVEIRPLGSDQTLKVLEAPLGVVRSNLVFSGWVLGVAVLSLAWLAATFCLYRRMVKSLGVRVLVLLALLGSLQFCLQFVGGLVSMGRICW